MQNNADIRVFLCLILYFVSEPVWISGLWMLAAIGWIIVAFKQDWNARSH